MEVNPLFTGQAQSSCDTPIEVTSAIKSLRTFQVEPLDSRFLGVCIDGEFGAPTGTSTPRTPPRHARRCSRAQTSSEGRPVEIRDRARRRAPKCGALGGRGLDPKL